MITISIIIFLGGFIIVNVSTLLWLLATVILISDYHHGHWLPSASRSGSYSSTQLQRLLAKVSSPFLSQHQDNLHQNSDQDCWWALGPMPTTGAASTANATTSSHLTNTTTTSAVRHQVATFSYYVVTLTNIIRGPRGIQHDKIQHLLMIVFFTFVAGSVNHQSSWSWLWIKVSDDHIIQLESLCNDEDDQRSLF